MAKGFDILNVKSAIKSRNKFDLSRTHLTTLDFGQIIPLFNQECVPGDEFNVKASYFSRMAPLVKPTYGKFSFRTMSAFVPYHQVCNSSEAFFAGASVWEGETPTLRWITPEVILTAMNDAACSYTVSSSTVAGGAWYDYTYVNGSGTRYYMRFTDIGRFFYKILTSLGYSLSENIDMQTTSYWYKNTRTQKLNALPLLAFCKAYNDWMSQSQRYNTSSLSKMLRAIRYNQSYNNSNNQNCYAPATQIISRYGIIELLSQIKLCYENNYFTSAWQSPNAALYNTNNNITVDENRISPGTSWNQLIGDYYDDNYWMEFFNESVIDGGVDFTVGIGQRSLDWLKSFDDYVRRNNYSGSRIVQQIYSRFGIKVEDYKNDYAHIIDTDIIPVQVGDITATAQDYVGAGNDANIALGDYAGKGITSGENGFTYKSKDYGMLFIFGWYTVDPMDCYGYDKEVLRTEAVDFYTPEFDGLGAEPITFAEVFQNPRTATSISASLQPHDDSVFGFTERYNSYRYGKDKITGDFRKLTTTDASNATVGTEMNTWHTGRMLTVLRDNGNLLAQGTDFNTLPQTNSEYNRIFSITDSSVDHFYMTAQFKVIAIRPMLNLNQVPKLGEGSTSVPRNGNEVN